MAEIYLLIVMTIIAAISLFYFGRTKKHYHGLLTKFQTKTQEMQKLNEKISNLKDEVQNLQTELQHTFEDPITQLISFELFEDRLNQNIKESERYQFTLGVLFIDINNFKMINDGLSYGIGNELLKEAGKRLLSCVRQVDSLSRFTKDTFVIFLAQLNKPETAAIVAQRILKTLHEPFVIQGHELFITVSIGIAIYPTDGQDVPGLLRSADHALHLAKERGTHSYQFYQTRLHTKSQRELALHTSLSRETIFNEFVIYYQPIKDMENNTLLCMDALLHWEHPTLGLINPIELFNYAKKHNKLNIISEWLLKTACKQFLDWHAAGLESPMLGMPLSMKQLDNSQFIYHISQIVQSVGFKPGWLLFEITESAANFSLDVLQKAFNMLKYIGVKTAIDNFGADSFALCCLKNVAIDYLKLDSSLLSDIESNEKTIALVKSIIELAKNMNISVIAQGVENDQQVSLLQALGCYLMQGHAIGAPLSQHEVTDKIAMPVEE